MTNSAPPPSRSVELAIGPVMAESQAAAALNHVVLRLLVTLSPDVARAAESILDDELGRALRDAAPPAVLEALEDARDRLGQRAA